MVNAVYVLNNTEYYAVRRQPMDDVTACSITLHTQNKPHPVDPSLIVFQQQASPTSHPWPRHAAGPQVIQSILPPGD